MLSGQENGGVYNVQVPISLMNPRKEAMSWSKGDAALEELDATCQGF